MILLWSALALGGPVADGLKAGIGKCYGELTAEGESPPDWVFEPSKGYAHIEGSYPTCGCTCSTTSAAFRLSDGSYRFLSRSAWACDWAQGLEGDDWQKALPPDLHELLLPGVPSDTTTGALSLDAVLPQSGTDTRLQVTLIPMGLDLPCPGGLCTYRSQRMARTSSTGIPRVMVEDLIEAGLSATALAALAQRGPDALSAADRAHLAAAIGDPGSAPERLATLQGYLQTAHARWTVVEKLTASELRLQWNRETGTFQVAPDGRTASSLSDFRAYLLAVPHFVHAC